MFGGMSKKRWRGCAASCASRVTRIPATIPLSGHHFARFLPFALFPICTSTLSSVLSSHLAKALNTSGRSRTRLRIHSWLIRVSAFGFTSRARFEIEVRTDVLPVVGQLEPITCMNFEIPVLMSDWREHIQRGWTRSLAIVQQERGLRRRPFLCGT